MRRWAMIAGTLLWTPIVVAGDKPEFGPAPDWVQPAERPAMTDAPGDAAIRFYLQDQQLNLGPAADEIFVENIVRIQTPQGLTAMGTLTLGWKPETDVLTVHKVHILRGAQVIDVLGSGQTFTVLRRENNLEFAALDGILTAVMQPAGLQVGDVLNVAFTLRRTEPVLAGISEQVAGGLPGVPVSRARIRARWPTATPIRWRPSDATMNVKEKRSGEYTEVSLAMNDSMPVLQPKGAPARFLVTRQIEFSGFRSWPDVGRQLAPLYARAAVLAPQSPLLPEVERIRASSADPRVRAAAALKLVQDQVRYVFLGMSDGAMVPTQPELTWSRRFGDCKAKTVLLMALLHALGIEADAVAVNSELGDGLNERLPMMAWMNHVLVRTVIDGTTYWLDGTRTGDRSLAELSVPGYRWGLPLVQGGSELVPIVPVPLERPLTEQTIHIDATAGLEVPAPFKVDSVLRGDPATVLKLQFANVTPADLDRGLRQLWSRIFDFVDIKTVSAKFDELSGEQRLSMEGTARMDWKKKRYEADGMSLGFKADFARPEGPNRDAPYAVAFPSFARATETILLPQGGMGFAVDGEDVDRTIAGVHYQRKATLKGNVFTAVASARSLVPEFPAAQAAEAEKALRELAKTTLHVKKPVGYELTNQEVAAKLDSTPATANEYITRGNTLMDRGFYDRAIADFTKALELDPRADMALADRGLAHLWKGDSKLAREDVDAALALNPRNPVGHRGRAMLAFVARDFTAAVSGFSRTLELEPDGIFDLHRRSVSYVQLGDRDSALADIATMERLQPHSKEHRWFKVMLLRESGRTAQAMEVVDSDLAAAAPDDSLARLGAGGLYDFLGNDAAAAGAYDRAIEIEPSAMSYVGRANYRAKKDPAGSLADVESALRLDSRSTQALLLRARLQSDAGDFAGAAATLDFALPVSKDSFYLMLARGVAHARGGKAALAKKDLDGARSQAVVGSLLNTFCQNLAEAGIEFDDALSACDEAVAEEPREPKYLETRGFVLLRMGRYEDAIAAYDAALRVEPVLPHALYGRGISRRRKGEMAAGDADIQFALRAFPDIGKQFAEAGVTP